jgi:putative acyl-CoA dehydrogenase
VRARWDFYLSAWAPARRAAPPAEVALAVLAADPALLAKVSPKVVTASYAPEFRLWWEKPGMTLGMGMTEKQGGTDVRANITTAGQDGLCGFSEPPHDGLANLLRVR